MQATGPAKLISFISSPFLRFVRMEAAGGVVLLVCVISALVWANSPWQHRYEDLLATQVSIRVGSLAITENRHEWINDGLMSLFFFLVGLEIKRELLVGELSSVRRASLPIAAAVGGILAPALIFLAFTARHGLGIGWAIPISTDIAFALAVLTVLKSRVPVELKVFVTALAIVDDIFAVAIIAVFYTNRINYVSLVLGLACCLISLCANVLGIRKPSVYAVIGLAAWCAVLDSGVHATIAGILIAFTIPVRTALDRSRFVNESRSLLAHLETAFANSAAEHSILHALEDKVLQAQSPLDRIEERLQPWISFLVVPLFAFANAGVNLSAHIAAAFRHPISLGIVLGLVIGKPAGVWLGSILAVRARLSVPLENVSSSQILGCGCICGIGFTMSLFVADLAFGEGTTLAISKIAILGASFLSAVLGAVLLGRQPRWKS